ncbi:mandelate racemase/muconate lactonizing enzyme family protein [Silvimonas amylolytica]|uniref:Mandelate racemase n=1 Tax=Silvimonas amylolytica TaxID=449663 RepID=A0ABQ2PLN1_9NEIS|nr:mandelate racemase/muconate lactonizing enzyme family protein [Silvimonas amylolytica]GGP26518.1 mandelate racemase [Silvimonas amylolytica]
MSKITALHIYLINLPPKTVRTDAIQSFVTQETPIVRIICDDGTEGIGYSYTIGTGGSSVIALLRDHLAPQLIGRDPACVEAIWRDLLFHTHATAVGAITSLALAAIDTALWDWRAKRASLPLWQLLGGAQEQVPVYTTEGGWLQLPQSALVEQTLAAQVAGFKGAKLKVGKPRAAEDVRRLQAVRDAVGDEFELMVDANQAFSVSEALRRADALAPLNLAWLEEPVPADNLAGHAQLAAHSRIPIAVGESLYSPGQFADYVQQQACSIIQVDVARVGGITPWLKVAQMAACHNLAVCPHFLMELHVSLCSAMPNATWLEYIPQLDDITTHPIQITDGMATPPADAGLGIAWNWSALEQRSLVRHHIS